MKQTIAIKETIPKNGYLDLSTMYVSEMEISSSGRIKWEIFDWSDTVIRTGFLQPFSTYLIQHLDSDNISGSNIRIHNMELQDFDVYLANFIDERDND